MGERGIMTTRQIGRRAILTAGAALAGTSAFAGRASAQTKDFVVGAFPGLYERRLQEFIIPEFQTRQNVKVKTEGGTGTNFVQKTLAARNRPVYHVFYLNEDEALVGEQANLFAPMDMSKVPNFADVYSMMRPPATSLYPCILYEFSLVYNPKKMKTPTSWTDLWQKGITVGVAHPSAAYGIYMLLIAAQMNGGGESDLAKGFPQLKKLDNMKIYRGINEGFQMLQREEIDATLFYTFRAQMLIDAGQPWAFTIPKEGTWLQRSGVQIPKTSPDLDLSYAWANMVMGPQYQEKFLADFYGPSNGKTVIPKDLAAKIPHGEEQMKKYHVGNWAIINPQKPALLERWNKEFT